MNELLKAIPAFKAQPGRLVIMATNSIAAIDKAMLRPGRFDLIIPVGAPDVDGRAELAREFLPVCDPMTSPHGPRALRRPTSPLPPSEPPSGRSSERCREAMPTWQRATAWLPWWRRGLR
ncbi:MAG TPA: AAA family ATPase [Acidimicrobiales bacterium]|nr:AAA family ATPase [Acidimicrobiales bacterium]